MTIFSNDTRGDSGPQRAGAHASSPDQSNADTGVFSQGDFCRVRALWESLTRQRSALRTLLNTVIILRRKIVKLWRINVDILRNSIAGTGKEDKWNPQRALISTSHSGEG